MVVEEIHESLLPLLSHCIAINDITTKGACVVPFTSTILVAGPVDKEYTISPLLGPGWFDSKTIIY